MDLVRRFEKKVRHEARKAEDAERQKKVEFLKRVREKRKGRKNLRNSGKFAGSLQKGDTIAKVLKIVEDNAADLAETAT